jgi:hypothetical protein
MTKRADESGKFIQIAIAARTDDVDVEYAALDQNGTVWAYHRNSSTRDFTDKWESGWFPLSNRRLSNRREEAK